MNFSHKWTVVVGAALTALVAGATHADAASNGLGGFAGHSQLPGNASCFQEDWGSVYSLCSSSPGWEVSLPVNSPGSNWTPNLHVYAPGSSSITCGAVGVSNDRLTISNNTPQQTDYDGPADLQFTVWVPQNGYLFTACYMGSGSEWYSVNY